jgi:mono/diheme cytochrome c family protein
MPLTLAGLVLAGLAGAALSQSEEEGEEERYEQAAIDFLSYCAPCHGRDAKGDGPVAMELVTKPADLTGLSARAGGTFPAEEVAKRIDGRELPKAHGTSDMPVWGYWFKLQANAAGLLQEEEVNAEAEVKERISRLVDYLATLQK